MRSISITGALIIDHGNAIARSPRASLSRTGAAEPLISTPISLIGSQTFAITPTLSASVRRASTPTAWR
ncbi:MAG: hypothetical protein R3F11_26375 [Verrucomicrobiales bacterium]